MRSSLIRQPCLGILAWAVPGIVLSDFVDCWIPGAIAAAVLFAVAMGKGRSVFAFGLLVFTAFLIRHDFDWRQNPGRLPIRLAEEGSASVRIHGIVTSDPAPTGLGHGTPHCRFDLQANEISNDGGLIRVNFPIQVIWSGPQPEWGDEVTMSGEIQRISGPRNPGEFDFASYLTRKGIFAEVRCDYPEDDQVLAHGKGNWLLSKARVIRAELQRRLALGIDDDPEIAGLVQTVTLGVKQETSAADRELFQHVGALHLFVVNGLHVALLASVLALLLKPFRIRRRGFALVIIPILFGYALITGLNPGSVRAAIMAAVVFGASFAERRPFSLNSLGAAALVLLVWDTNELFQPGFQFSFGVVASIILLAGWIQKPILPLGVPDAFLPRSLWTRWQHMRNTGWRYVSGLAGVSIAASMGSFPFSAGYFNLITPSGFVANLLLVPLAFLILAESVFSLFGCGAKLLSVAFNNVNWLLASGMLWIVHGFAWLPGGHFFVSTSATRLPECRITVLDLKPGQSIVIQTSGCCWLVDCGNSYGYSRVVRPFLQSCGINRLDGFILTHGAASSIGAAEDVIRDYAPRDVFESSVTDRSPVRRRLQEALEKGEVPKEILEAGDDLAIGGKVRCKVLFPQAGYNGRTASDKSLALEVEDGKAKVILLSDSGFSGERWLLDNGVDVRAAVVVIGGESKDLAGTPDFLRTAHCSALVIGSSLFGPSPGSEWESELPAAKVVPFDQTETGAVTIDMDSMNATVVGFMNGQRLTRRID